MRATWLSLLIVVVSLCGCATNPVTGKTELTLISESQEIAMGQQYYKPSRQMQGGDYIRDPDLTAYVSSVGQRLAQVSDRPDLPYEFVVLNDSVPNAWALPGGKIAVNRGLLLELNSEAELAAVLGHEIVHAAARHSAKGQERSLILSGLLVVTQVAVQDNDFANLLVGGAQVGASLITQKYGREAELESDRYGMAYMSRAGYDPAAAIDLQETFVRLSEGRQTNWLSGLFASHPPSAERVAANRATAAELDIQGDYGRERYQQALTSLRRSAGAYKAYDDAVAALGKGDRRTALQLANQAIQAEPGEARFYSLVGDVHFGDKRYREALDYYRQSLERDSGYFQTYLTSGLAKQELGDLRGAESDLKRSMDLLPTATASNALGNIALRSGRRAEAVEYLRMAAGSNSAVGTEAGASLARLELANNPEQYVQTQLRVDERGNLILLVANRAPVAIRDVQGDLLLLDPTGRRVVAAEPFRFRASIGANTVGQFATGVGPVTDQATFDRYRVRLRGAEPAE